MLFVHSIIPVAHYLKWVRLLRSTRSGIKKMTNIPKMGNGTNWVITFTSSM